MAPQRFNGTSPRARGTNRRSGNATDKVDRHGLKPLGGGLFAQVKRFAGVTKAHIRVWVQTPNNEPLYPTIRGVTMDKRQLDLLAKEIPQMRQDLKKSADKHEDRSEGERTGDDSGSDDSLKPAPPVRQNAIIKSAGKANKTKKSTKTKRTKADHASSEDSSSSDSASEGESDTGPPPAKRAKMTAKTLGKKSAKKPSDQKNTTGAKKPALKRAAAGATRGGGKAKKAKVDVTKPEFKPRVTRKSWAKANDSELSDDESISSGSTVSA